MLFFDTVGAWNLANDAKSWPIFCIYYLIIGNNSAHKHFDEIVDKQERIGHEETSSNV